MYFSVVLPTAVTITCKLAGEVVDTQTLTAFDFTTVFMCDKTIDFMQISFNGAYTNQRIHLSHIEMDGTIDYLLTYHELKNTPIANSLEKVSDLKVHYYTYNYEKTEIGTSRSSYVRVNTVTNTDGGESVDIATGTSDYGSAISTVKAVEGDNTVIFNEAYYNYKK